MLADPDKAVAGAYGTLGPIGFPRRSVFIVDGDGVIRYAHRAIAGLTYRPVSELVDAPEGSVGALSTSAGRRATLRAAGFTNWEGASMSRRRRFVAGGIAAAALVIATVGEGAVEADHRPSRCSRSSRASR